MYTKCSFKEAATQVATVICVLRQTCDDDTLMVFGGVESGVKPGVNITMDELQK